MLAYSTSKAAVIGLTKTIGKEYAETGITVNALAPAVVRTQMVEEMPPEQVKYMTDKIPMKRCGTIDEIASMVTFMEEDLFTSWNVETPRLVYLRARKVEDSNFIILESYVVVDVPHEIQLYREFSGGYYFRRRFSPNSTLTKFRPQCHPVYHKTEP
eukprot:scaffold2384_cov80-Cylindrotheca_fusiformis.AAC.3